MDYSKLKIEDFSNTTYYDTVQLHAMLQAVSVKLMEVMPDLLLDHADLVQVREMSLLYCGGKNLSTLKLERPGKAVLRINYLRKIAENDLESLALEGNRELRGRTLSRVLAPSMTLGYSHSRHFTLLREKYPSRENSNRHWEMPLGSLRRLIEETLEGQSLTVHKKANKGASKKGAYIKAKLKETRLTWQLKHLLSEHADKERLLLELSNEVLQVSTKINTTKQKIAEYEKELLAAGIDVKA